MTAKMGDVTPPLSAKSTNLHECSNLIVMYQNMGLNASVNVGTDVTPILMDKI